MSTAITRPVYPLDLRDDQFGYLDPSQICLGRVNRQREEEVHYLNTRAKLQPTAPCGKGRAVRVTKLNGQLVVEFLGAKHRFHPSEPPSGYRRVEVFDGKQSQHQPKAPASPPQAAPQAKRSVQAPPPKPANPGKELVVAPSRQPAKSAANSRPMPLTRAKLDRKGGWFIEIGEAPEFSNGAVRIRITPDTYVYREQGPGRAELKQDRGCYWLFTTRNGRRKPEWLPVGAP